MANQDECNNFLSKFLHLLRIGKSAQLVFECQEGQARVHFHHDLGQLQHLPQPPHCHAKNCHQGPSRLRRRARRAVTRAAATAVEYKPVEVNGDGSKTQENDTPNFDAAENDTVLQEIAHKAC